MLALSVLTVATLVVAYGAAVLIDCAASSVQLPWTDPLALCAGVESFGLDVDPWLGAGLAVFSLLALVATWLPVLRRHRRKKRVEPERSLTENLSRIAPRSSGTPGTAPAEEEVAEEPSLRDRVAELEQAMGSTTVPSRDATSAWMRLLREANDLHNVGELATEDFKEINTRLLDLVEAPVGSGRARS